MRRNFFFLLQDNSLHRERNVIIKYKFGLLFFHSSHVNGQEKCRKIIPPKTTVGILLLQKHVVVADEIEDTSLSFFVLVMIPQTLA
uniref:Uncharacterized protein n=1 Tax=Nelumbo nucifera TaxID=4432 RepID=A0A822XGQ3_NELNU|nr:TPA_asm: hypothetical protein HUJ06_020575 [Nelumbo nucifera]